MNGKRLERIEDALVGLPVVGGIFAAGSSDPIYDLLMVAGPLLLLVVRVFGRGPVTLGLVVAYILVFVGYVVNKHRQEGRIRA